MTVDEMIIDIEQKLKKVGAHSLTSIVKDEYVWWLNEAQQRFIKSKHNDKVKAQTSGHQAIRKSIDDLEEILTTANLPCFVVDDEHTKSILPSDYFLPSSESITVARNCRGVSKTTVSYPTTMTKLAFPFEYLATEESDNYYEDVKIFVTVGEADIVLFDCTVFPAIIQGVTDPDEYFVVLQYILDHINDLSKANDYGIEVYWEEYAGYRYNNHFIIVCSNPDAQGDSATWDSNVEILPEEEGDPLPTVYYSATALELTYTIYDPTGTSYSSKKVEGRVLSNEGYRHNLNHPFNKSIYTSPVCLYEDGMIKIYHDDTFVPLGLELKYYRKPRAMSLLTQQNCELNPNVHSEIVDLAVTLLLGKLSNPSLQSNVAVDTMTL
jgi:thioredoxin-related protein